MKIKRRFFLCITLIFVVMVLGLETVSAEGVFKIGRNDDSTTMDPIKTTQNVDIWVINNVHAFLVRANREGNDIEADLAKSWEVSDDKLTFTFHLREAHFSDGSPVKASDAVFSLLRLRDDQESTQKSLFAGIKSVTAPNDKTVVIKLSQPSAAFLSTLAMYAASILPEKAVKSLGDQFSTSPVSAGIYRVVEWRRGEMLALEPNPHYYVKNISSLDRVEWHVVPEDNTRVLRVAAGELDAAIGIPFSLLPVAEADPNINIHLDPSTREDHMLMNHTNPFLADKKIRKAINMALDINAIIKVATFGRSKPANSMIPAGTLYYNPDNKTWPYDLEEAKKLVAESGKNNIALDFVISAGSKIQEQVAVMTQQQLRRINIRVAIKKIDPGQVWGAFVDGNYDLSMAYWTYDILDPDQKVAFSVDGADNLSFYTRYNNPVVAKLVSDARLELDPDKRRDLYYKIQKVVKEDAHWVDLYYSPFSNISRKEVKGFYQNPLGTFPLHEIKL